MNLFQLLTLSIASITVTNPAVAGSHLSVVGGLSSTQTRTTLGDVGVKSRSGFGPAFGALYEMTFSRDMVGVETGILYVTKKVSLESRTATYETSLGFIEVPLVARAWLLSVVSIGAGGYLDYGYGKVGRVVTSTGIPVKSSPSYSEMSLEQVSVGALAVASAYIPVMPMFGVLADLRYEYGITELSTNPLESTRISSVLFLAGLQLRL